MKITACLFALAAASTHGIDGNHHLNGAGIQNNHEVINDQNIRPDGQIGSNRNQITRNPTPAPTAESDAFNNMQDARDEENVSGTTDQIDEQTDVDAMPTVAPTAFPTKIQATGDTTDPENVVGKGSKCCEGDFCKPVGWVGAGDGDQFCNVWKCNPSQTAFSKGTDSNNNGHFSKQIRKCSVDESSHEFCSHTTCTFATNDFSGGKKVINVRSDHRETTGGLHLCGYAKHGMQGGHRSTEMASHVDANNVGETGGTDRPACDCVCHGDRRQDADNFARVLNQARVLNEDSTDETTNNGAYDTAHNGNNFYSKHSHADAYAENSEQYSNDQYVAHHHSDSGASNPYDETHKSAALYAGN